MYLNLCVCGPEVIIFLNHSSPYLLKPGLSLNLEFICLALLAGHWAPGICMFPTNSAQCQRYRKLTHTELFRRSELGYSCLLATQFTEWPFPHPNWCTEKRSTSALWAWVMTSSQLPALRLKQWFLCDNPGLKGTCTPKLATLHVSCQDLKMCWLVCRSCILDSYGFSKPYIVRILSSFPLNTLP